MVTNEMFRAMWNTGRPQETRPADLLFVDYLYQWLVEHYNVDKSRVYASGQSSGGMMSWACACYRSDYFAAVAPVSAKTQNIENEPEPFVKGSVIPVIDVYKRQVEGLTTSLYGTSNLSAVYYSVLRVHPSGKENM